MLTKEIVVKDRGVYANGQDMSLVRTSIGTYEMHVLFDDSEWLDFPVQVTFGNGNITRTQTLTLASVTSTIWAAESTCEVPWEVMQDLNSVTLTFFGTNNDGDHIITAYGAPLYVTEAGSVGDGTVPEAAPTIDQYTQAYNNAVLAANDAASAAAQISEILGSTDAETLAELLDELGDAMRYQGSVADYASLPASPSVGDVYKVTAAYGDYAAGTAWVYYGSAWVALSGTGGGGSGSIVEGYYYEGAFYEDSSHTTAITGATGNLYVDLPNSAIYRYDGSTYVALSGGGGGSSYTLPTMSASTKGGAMLGAGLDVTNDVLSVDTSTIAQLASPSFTGTPTAPTAATGTNTTQIASAAFVQQEITANAYSHPTSGATAGSYGDGAAQTPSFGGTFKALSETVDANGHVTAIGEHSVTIPSDAATTSAAGLMSAADKTKLDGIDASANAYTLPTMDASTKGGAKLGTGLAVASDTLSVDTDTIATKSYVNDEISGITPTALTETQMDDVAADTSVTSTNVMTGTALSYWWSKLKAAFAAVTHDHSGHALTPASVAATGDVTAANVTATGDVSDSVGSLADLRDSVSSGNSRIIFEPYDSTYHTVKIAFYTIWDDNDTTAREGIQFIYDVANNRFQMSCHVNGSWHAVTIS